MIYNANKMLDKALSVVTKKRGVPRRLFTQAKGIVLISAIEAGFILSGSNGQGIFMAKNAKSNQWGAPCAIGLNGMSWGMTVLGASAKTMMLFLLDDDSVNAMIATGGIKFGEVKVESYGRTAEVALTSRNTGTKIGSATVAFTRGFFAGGGASLESCIISPKNGTNSAFYGIQDVSPKHILLNMSRNEVPQQKKNLMSEVYMKLDLMAAGVTVTEVQEVALSDIATTETEFRRRRREPFESSSEEEKEEERAEWDISASSRNASSASLPPIIAAV